MIIFDSSTLILLAKVELLKEIAKQLEVVIPREVEREIKLIEEMARKEGKDKSTISRQLIGYGLTYLMIRLYKEGRFCLEKVAKKLDLSVGETIDLLSEFGIKAPIDYEDYLKGYEVMKEVL